MGTKTEYDNNGTLVVIRVYDAPRQAVFDAWMETSKVQDWWGCADTVEVKSEIEPKLGGKYCHEMTLRNGYVQPGRAEFIEYDPPRVFAYAAPRSDEMPEGEGMDMKVRVEFIELNDNQTEVRLTHTGIPHEFSPFIEDGWTAAFGKLFRFLVTQAHAA